MSFRPYEEVAITGMTYVANGDAVATMGLDDGAAINFWDVDVRRFREDGSVDILEEHENLQEDEANRIFERLCTQYPDADQAVNY
jgi:hypothetical protein